MAERKNFRFYWEEPLKKEAKEGPSMHIEVPGFRKDEIKVNLTSKSVTVVASKKYRKVHRNSGYYSGESFSSSFSKSVTLPHEIDTSSFDIVIKDGSVTLKRKKKEAKGF